MLSTIYGDLCVSTMKNLEAPAFRRYGKLLNVFWPWPMYFRADSPRRCKIYLDKLKVRRRTADEAGYFVCEGCFLSSALPEGRIDALTICVVGASVRRSSCCCCEKVPFNRAAQPGSRWCVLERVPRGGDLRRGTAQDRGLPQYGL